MSNDCFYVTTGLLGNSLATFTRGRAWASPVRLCLVRNLGWRAHSPHNGVARTARFLVVSGQAAQPDVCGVPVLAAPQALRCLQRRAWF